MALASPIAILREAEDHELAPDEDPQEIIEFNEFLTTYEAESPEDKEDNDEEDWLCAESAKQILSAEPHVKVDPIHHKMP